MIDDTKRKIIVKINRAKQKLSTLLTKRETIISTINDLTLELSNVKEEIEYANQSLLTLQENLDNIPDYNKDGIVISDHAIVRYLERIHNIDIDKIKDTILDDYLESYIIEHRGNGKFHNSDSTFRATVKDGVIVTIVRGKKYDKK